MTRRATVDDSSSPDIDHTALGNLYLRKLEVDPVIQAAGRVRFLTKPREVIFFQMHELGRDVGDCTDVRSLNVLRETLELPSAKELDVTIQASQAQKLIDKGLTVEQAATQLGVSRRTLFRRLRSAKSAKNPIRIFMRPFWRSRRCSGKSREHAMKRLQLLGDWPERMSSAEDVRPQRNGRQLLATAIDLPRASEGIIRVETASQAEEFISTLKSVPVSAVAIDSEYTFDRPEIELRSREDLGRHSLAATDLCLHGCVDCRIRRRTGRTRAPRSFRRSDTGSRPRLGGTPPTPSAVRIPPRKG